MKKGSCCTNYEVNKKFNTLRAVFGRPWMILCHVFSERKHLKWKSLNIYNNTVLKVHLNWKLMLISIQKNAPGSCLCIQMIWATKQSWLTPTHSTCEESGLELKERFRIPFTFINNNTHGRIIYYSWKTIGLAKGPIFETSILKTSSIYRGQSILTKIISLRIH